MFTVLCVISNHCWVTRRTSSTVWWNLENYYNNTDEKKNYQSWLFYIYYIQHCEENQKVL